MKKIFRKILFFNLIALLMATGIPAVAYGQPQDSISKHDDPFKMMVDTTPELSLEEKELIRSLAPESISEEGLDEMPDNSDAETRMKKSENAEALRRVIKNAVDSHEENVC